MYFKIISTFFILNIIKFSNGFDELVLAMQYPPGLKYSIPYNDYVIENHYTSYSYMLTVHGLWTRYSSGRFGPSNCKHPESFSINEVNKISGMEKYWPSFIKTNENFWKHEWDKHGTCIANISSIRSFREFFQTTIDLAKKVNTVYLPKIINFYKTDNVTKNYRSGNEIIYSATGHWVELLCKNYKLVGINFCFTINLEPVRCKLRGTCQNGFSIDLLHTKQKAQFM